MTPAYHVAILAAIAIAAAIALIAEFKFRPRPIRAVIMWGLPFLFIGINRVDRVESVIWFPGGAVSADRLEIRSRTM